MMPSYGVHADGMQYGACFLACCPAATAHVMACMHAYVHAYLLQVSMHADCLADLPHALCVSQDLRWGDDDRDVSAPFRGDGRADW